MGTTYTYRGMPFGLNDAPRVFTQIMKKCVMAIREIWRIRCVVYLDDLLLHPDKNYLAKLAPQITQLLQYYGSRKITPTTDSAIPISGINMRFGKYDSSTKRQTSENSE
jgi:hypothetical protein